ncbi:bifunctional hydroxymethylpyrimidine kinase/phosphomethylpyrimidine kinase [Phocicoccus pinnipedialis]|uniref:Hydroxymethylpyrimidine/phosphomethylpyrimidine kinase n=1 Tax=Phocicoccus pinnipedialis TaxID=110845 RepID=A0A6V7R404_9BACL|nr:bifunctional hydroxymethylpyrimidine kinase/phosphomethylpyrimidine kinase [Jeotgalicoccus pinnipedialis]MBP1939925.1 hydroxymethylpyrimidine/phosphomethylpyrimidine kinase [Jeotgalicoccus pinnipedialis]CAD2072127.1 Hydroxymethylpyrimidine/phosphomethylpyrimidine kinase [Jeotgalicoccus pinnipedialis]
MSHIPIALTVASNDPTGGSGVIADIKTFHNLNVFGMAAITNLTAQNSQGIHEILEIPPEFLEEQLSSIFSDAIPYAMKSGMVPSADMVDIIKKYIKGYDIPFVMDPFIFSKEGKRIIDTGLQNKLATTLLPYASVVTPNIKETEAMTGIDIKDESDIKTAANIFLKEIGVKSVLINDSQMTGKACDYLYTRTKEVKLSGPIIKSKNLRGVGSTFSAVITAELAKGQDLESAFRKAKMFVTKAIENGFDIGKGNGPISHFIEL